MGLHEDRLDCKLQRRAHVVGGEDNADKVTAHVRNLRTIRAFAGPRTLIYLLSLESTALRSRLSFLSHIPELGFLACPLVQSYVRWASRSIIKSAERRVCHCQRLPINADFSQSPRREPSGRFCKW